MRINFLSAETWRPLAAYVYLFICICDFVLMPTYYVYNNEKSKLETVEMALMFSGGAGQIEALKALQMEEVWDPLTLRSSGLFHLSFGAILGVSAWTKNREDKMHEHDAHKKDK